MKTARALLAASACLAPAFAGYTYDYANLLNPYNSSQWSATGSNNASSNMYTSSASNGGSLIFTSSLPAPSNSYEVRTTLTLTSSGGNYLTYLRASYGSLLASGNNGTFYAIEIANPTISGSSCTATLNIFKQTGANTLINPYSGPINCHNGMVVRAVVIPANAVAVYIDNRFYTSWGWGDSSPITGGQPGVGVSGAPSGNGISTIDIGHLDTIAPNALNVQQVGTSSFPTRVDIQFPGDVDDPNGTGVAYYQFWRCTGTSCSPNWLDLTTTPQFTDTTVSPGTTYTYLLQAQDFHYNSTTITITVATPSAGSIDPRQVGVRPLGTYWGHGGEQLDMRSGNLNYTIPLFKAMARGGWGVGFSLSYNSQNWRQDSGGTWELGRDIGYGYGWRMQAGSLTPVYKDYWDVDHYLYIDSTGAEYRLDQNNGGVWSSKEGIYVYYDSSTGLLHFRDGSFWVLGSLSSGTEQDSGTMYPTQIEDANGNQINITYNNGDGVTWTNSSSRINTVADVRRGGANTYTFTYTNDTIPHLASISNAISTAENYTFGYISNYTLTTPFGGGTGYGTYTMLQCANSVTIPGSTTFAYDSAAAQSCSNYSGGSGPGELTEMNTPAGGHLRWAYGAATYVSSRTQREVQNRYLLMASGGTEYSYAIDHSSDPSGSYHAWGAVIDAGALGEKFYAFETSTSDGNVLGMPIYYINYSNRNTGIAHVDYFASKTDPAGNPYIWLTYGVEDSGTSTSVWKETTQTLDQYGNVTQMQVYNYGTPGSNTPGSLARTYTNTYLNSSNYTSRYIFNRLASSSVTDGTHTTTLVTNSYDQNTYADVPNITMHDSNYGTSFSSRGNLTTSTSPGGTKTVAYDIGGNTTSATTNGVTTSVTTNSNTNWAAPSQLTTNSLQSSMNWDTALNLTSASGPNGDTTSIAYAAGERPNRSTAPTGAVTDYTYVDGVNPSVTATTCPIAGFLPSQCPVTTHWVKSIKDGFGRTVETDTGYGSTTVSIVKTNYTPCGCTPLGKMNQVSQPYAPGGSPVYTTYNYDGMGRTTSVVAPDGSTTAYSYASNTVTVTDPAGKYKTFTMDALGNLTQVQESDPSLGLVTTTYTYDMLSHLTGVSMPRGSTTQTRTFNYTSGTTVGALLLSATNPENGTVTYTYNSAHQVLTRTDAKSQKTQYTYDSYGRLSEVQHFYYGTPCTCEDTAEQWHYYYDAPIDPNYPAVYTGGRLAAVTFAG
ncbi:MAG TPA: hypothetical protein VEV17_05650, partial [Bryobacteraceae bacterium]|nr:hypothetical protein [Bryobacteraceae bacterium]